MGRNKNNEVTAALLPQELGFDSGMTCWRRLRDWHAAGVWHEFHLTEAARCTAQVEKLDFIRFSMFGASVLSPARRTVHRPQTDGLGQAGQQASHHHGNPRYRRDALRHRVQFSHLVTPVVPRSVSCAKYAAAFLRNTSLGRLQ